MVCYFKKYVEFSRPKIESSDPFFFTGTQAREFLGMIGCFHMAPNSGRAPKSLLTTASDILGYSEEEQWANIRVYWTTQNVHERHLIKYPLTPVNALRITLTVLSDLHRFFLYFGHRPRGTTCQYFPIFVRQGLMLDTLNPRIKGSNFFSLFIFKTLSNGNLCHWYNTCMWPLFSNMYSKPQSIKKLFSACLLFQNKIGLLFTLGIIMIFP